MKPEQFNTADVVADMTKGNKQAESFLMMFYHFCHTLDDLVDHDKPVSQDLLVRSVLGFILQVSHNEFYQANRAGFESLLTMAAMAWLDSEERQGKPEALYLKSWYWEIFFYAALLCGGWAHAREMSAKYRVYEPPKPT